MNISDIKPYVRNAKLHDKKQIELLAKIVGEVGWRQPCLVNQEGTIVAGHGRYLAWQTHKGKYQLKDIWVMDDKGKTIFGKPETKPLTPELEEAYRLADNQVNAMTGFDMKIVVPILKELSLSMLELTGFDKDLIIEPDDKDDVIPENVPARTKVSDVYELGEHRLICGDSTSKVIVEELLNGVKPDMVFTDPPYGVDYVSRVDKDRRKAWGGIKNDDLKGIELRDFLEKAVSLDFRCHQYICCNWQSVKDFFDALGMPNSLIVWDKKSIGLGANYRSQHEFILFYGKLNHRNETNVWSLKRDNLVSYKHPTQKPVELIVRAIVNSSEEGGGFTIVSLARVLLLLLVKR